MIIYSLETRGSGCALRIYANGYKLYESSGTAHNFSSSLRPWMEKENVVRIIADPSGASKEGEPIQFTAVVERIEGEERKELCKLDYPNGIAETEILKLPFDTREKKYKEGHSDIFICEDEKMLLERPWLAEGVAIQSLDEVYGLFVKIRDAFHSGNVEEVMKLSTERIAFGAKLYEMPREEYTQAIRRDLVATLGAKPRWKKTGEPARQLLIHEYKEGKIMRLTDLNGNAAIVTEPDPDGSQMGYDLIFCASGKGVIWIM